MSQEDVRKINVIVDFELSMCYLLGTNVSDILVKINEKRVKTDFIYIVLAL